MGKSRFLAVKGWLPVADPAEVIRITTHNCLLGYEGLATAGIISVEYDSGQTGIHCHQSCSINLCFMLIIFLIRDFDSIANSRSSARTMQTRYFPDWFGLTQQQPQQQRHCLVHLILVASKSGLCEACCPIMANEKIVANCHQSRFLFLLYFHCLFLW